MPDHLHDQLVFTPADVDLARSPLAGRFAADTYVLGAFNPALARLPNGNLLLMVRVAEALRQPVWDGAVHAIRWEDGAYRLNGWLLSDVDRTDPRTFLVAGGQWPTFGLTSLSWLLPVELSADGLEVVRVHYDRAIAPAADFQSYGVEDPRISVIEGRYFLTACCVSAQRQGTCLYTSNDGLDWALQGLILDHQNKDMVLFNGLIGGAYWAQTRPLGTSYPAYPPGAKWRAGPSINLARSPDALHWKPHEQTCIRSHAATTSTARLGGGAPPVLTRIADMEGWLSLWHGVEPDGAIGIYRTFWSLLAPADPAITLATQHSPLLEANAALTAPLAEAMYVDNVVFTTGLIDAGDHLIIASGEADLACRITHLSKDALRPS
ncbi:glycosidase [Croceicoccus sp. F390]|uniref:Glycosidase n=1 Tax=Croceicoccus esteveae TaxID=3075597 RepID=A0ABU2ZE91_9SPHN|nr:glycosidase [Croceicoccus sp. F390]MDT0574917.1 glycosidase [Croceicoccus sp. F390]